MRCDYLQFRLIPNVYVSDSWLACRIICCGFSALLENIWKSNIFGWKTEPTCPKQLAWRYSNGVKQSKAKKAKRQRHGTWYSAAKWCAVALYNLGSGSRLALATVLRRKLAAPIARANGLWTRSYAARRTTPQSATLGLHPVIHVPNYMDHYSFTDPWGMDGWVDHVGWSTADGLTTQ